MEITNYVIYAINRGDDLFFLTDMGLLAHAFFLLFCITF